MAASKRKSIPTKSNLPARGLPPATEKDVQVRVFNGHTDIVWRVAMPDDGRFVLTSSEDGTVRRWMLEDDGKEGRIVCKGNPFRALAVMSDGSRAAAGGQQGSIHVIEVSTGRVLLEWKGHHKSVGNVAFYIGGPNLLSAAEDGYLRRWNADSGAPIARCMVPFEHLYGVAASANGSRIVGAALGGGLALWSGRNGAEPVVFEENVAGQSPISLPADGSFAFTGTGDGKVVKWHLTEGRRVAAFEGHSG